jgi:hypothetical protein
MKKRTKKRPMKKRAAATPPTTQPIETPKLPPLSSRNIAQILSHFMTFRSTISDLSSSLQRIEKMLDSTYQIFEIAHLAIGQRGGPRRLPGFFKRNNERQQEGQVPVINLPDEDTAPNASLAPLLQNFDPQLIMRILRSPLAQRLISQLFSQPQAMTSSHKKHRQ